MGACFTCGHLMLFEQYRFMGNYGGICLDCGREKERETDA